MAKKGWIISISLILGLLLFGYIIGDIPIGETISLLENFKIHYLVIYLAVSLGRQLSFTLLWHIILKSQSEDLPFVTLLNYRMADYAISFLTPGPKVGGEFTRSSLLEKHDIEYSKALSSTVIDKTMEIFGNALFLMLGVIIITPLVDVPTGWEVFFYAISIIFLLFMTGFFASMAKEKSWFHFFFSLLRLDKIKKLKGLEEGIIRFENHIQDFYSKKRKYFFYSVLATVPAWILSLIEMKYLTLMLGFHLNWAQLFLIAHFIGAIYLIPVPLALGTLEASQITIFALLGKDTKGGVMVAMITRVRDALLSAWGLGVLGVHGIDWSNTKEAIERYYKKSASWLDDIREGNGLF